MLAPHGDHVSEFVPEPGNKPASAGSRQEFFVRHHKAAFTMPHRRRMVIEPVLLVLVGTDFDQNAYLLAGDFANGGYAEYLGVAAQDALEKARCGVDILVLDVYGVNEEIGGQFIFPQLFRGLRRSFFEKSAYAVYLLDICKIGVNQGCIIKGFGRLVVVF